MVYASFAGDSLALGAHWIYEPDVIARDFGRVESFLKPAEGSYHSGKRKGDFTHYGDQALVLLRSVAETGAFDIQSFFEAWRKFFDDYSGYRDRATRASLQSFSVGRSPVEGGSDSNDLAGAVRISPLVYLYRDDPALLDSSAAAQTAMTHNDPETVQCAGFLGAVAAAVLHGAPPVDAMLTEAEKRFSGSMVEQWVRAGVASRDSDSVKAIARFGRTCHTPEAFPGVVHLVARHENSLKEALVQSVMAGGDSAARNMAVGMILGARLGYEGIPPSFIEELNAGEEIAALLAKLDEGENRK